MEGAVRCHSAAFSSSKSRQMTPSPLQHHLKIEARAFAPELRNDTSPGSEAAPYRLKNRAAGACSRANLQMWMQHSVSAHTQI